MPLPAAGKNRCFINKCELIFLSLTKQFKANVWGLIVFTLEAIRKHTDKTEHSK